MLFAVRATQRLAADYIVMKDDLREKYKIKRRYFGNIVRDEADRNILENFMAAYGGCEPAGAPYDGAIDVAVVPLLAVNSRGYRLGYGGGYYDRFLHGKNILKVGLGYRFQLTDEFEEDAWDEPLDEFICERGIFRFGRDE